MDDRTWGCGDSNVSETCLMQWQTLGDCFFFGLLYRTKLRIFRSTISQSYEKKNYNKEENLENTEW